MNVTLPPPLDIYLSAEASTDVARLANCFASDAVVRDEGRTITGLDAIKAWKKDTPLLTCRRPSRSRGSSSGCMRWSRPLLRQPPNPLMQPTNAGGIGRRSRPSLHAATTDRKFSQVFCS